MSFTQELTCRWSTSNWTSTKLLQGHLHRNCYTGVATQEFIVLTCKIRLLQFFYFSLAAGGARRWLTKCYPLRHVGRPNCVAKCRSCLSLGKHVVWWSANLLCPQQPFAEIARVGRPTCGGMWIILGTGNPLQVGRPNMWQNADLVRLGGTTWRSTVKDLCKIVILKVHMQAWHESQTAITVENCHFVTPDANVQE